MARIAIEKTLKNVRGKLCDDVSGHAENVFFVLDGATPLFDDHVFSERSDVFDFMQQLRDTLEAQAKTTDTPSLTKLLENSIEIAHEKLSIPDDIVECEGPNYTVAMIRTDEDGTEYYLCADAYILVECELGGITALTDERFAPFEAENTRQIALLEDDENKEQRKIEIYRQTRRKANRPGGYVVTSANPKSAQNGIFGWFSTSNVKRILLCSDGYMKRPYPYPDLDPEHVEEHAQDMAAVASHDDITYMLIEI